MMLMEVFGLKTTFRFRTLFKKNTAEESESIKNTLIEILHQAYLLNPDFISKFRRLFISPLN